MENRKGLEPEGRETWGLEPALLYLSCVTMNKFRKRSLFPHLQPEDNSTYLSRDLTGLCEISAINFLQAQSTVLALFIQLRVHFVPSTVLILKE